MTDGLKYIKIMEYLINNNIIFNSSFERGNVIISLLKAKGEDWKCKISDIREKDVFYNISLAEALVRLNDEDLIRTINQIGYF